MNDSFNLKNHTHRNLAAKMRNTVSEIRWYLYRLLRANGFCALPGNSIEMLESIDRDFWPDDFKHIYHIYKEVQNATPQTADRLWYSTWRFLHDFDNKLKNVQI